MKTLTRYIPTGFTEYKPDLGDYPKDLFTVYVDLDKITAIFYTGKQSKHTFYNRFRTVDDMKKKINDTISALMSWEDRKVARKAERKEKIKNMDVSQVKIGDIYHWTGGYNCTRNAYVKVVGFVSKGKVSVIELPKTQISGDWMNGEVAPIVDFTDVTSSKTFVIRPGYNGGVILRNTKTGYKDDYRKWNGKPNWENCD